MYSKKALVCLIILLGAAAGLQGEEKFATPNDAFLRGAPTFVAGTLGSDLEDGCVRAQMEVIRDMIFPGAPMKDDGSIRAAEGPEAWPRNPVLYGGPHVNRVLAALAPTLPFRMEQGRLVIGDRTFEGDQYQFIAMIPAREPDEQGPGYPEFLLYAGTGMPGIAGVNATHHGGEPLLVIDAFGRYLAGTWKRDEQGRVIPHFPKPPAPRLEWRTKVHKLESGGEEGGATVNIRFPKMLPANDHENTLCKACMRGLARSVEKLGITDPVDLDIYFYPDRNSKKSLTGQRGDGHINIASRAMHLLPFDPSEGGPLETLVMHEGTHILSYKPWGAPGSALLGEGLAVWVSGQYGGQTLEEWARLYQGKTPPIAGYMTKEFFKLAERETYPLSGLYLGAVIEKVGLDQVKQHLYGATAVTWAEACEKAGTTPQDLEKAFFQALGHE